MIPKVIHYCWFGRGPMPQVDLDCIESWHKNMPDWEYKLWNEDNFDVNCNPYVKEAYEARKFAFVSDYARLIALQNIGGVYLDTDVMVLKPLDDLLQYKAFSGFEGSKKQPVMTSIIASEPNGEWVKEQLALYEGLHFVKADGSLDLLPNTSRFLYSMESKGFIPNGLEQDYKDLHIFPTDYFCPRQTTGEYLLTSRTYCDHIGVSSWSDSSHGFKSRLLRCFGPQMRTKLIKIKRRIFG